MKRQGITLAEVAERGNLLLATWKAARGKQRRPAVARFLSGLDWHLDALASNILTGRAPLGRYRSFTIHDPKRRTIHAACFADRVLHHAVLNLCEARFERMLVDSTYACRPGKGVHAAAARVQHNLRRYAWWVRVDVDAYFPSIDHVRLKELLRTRFKGADFLDLLDRIIDSGTPDPCYRPGLGLPIGSLTSQHFANAYLDVGDRMLLADRRVRAHVRYMDDILWWCDTHEDARATLIAFSTFLREARGLELKPTACIGRSRVGVAYCGFRTRPGVILPSRRKLTGYRRHATQLEQAWAGARLTDAELQRGAETTQAALAHSQSLGFRQRYWREHPSAYSD